MTLSISAEISPEVTQAAEALACLLTDTLAFQNYVRLARVVRLDGEVSRLVALLNGYSDGEIFEESNAQALEEQLESLPVMCEYRQAESAARLIFSAVEEAISGAAGVSFVEHARPSACS